MQTVIPAQIVTKCDACGCVISQYAEAELAGPKPSVIVAFASPTGKVQNPFRPEASEVDLCFSCGVEVGTAIAAAMERAAKKARERAALSSSVDDKLAGGA